MRPVLLLCVLLSSCAPYADFGLPKPTAGPALKLDWKTQAAPVLVRGDAVDVLNPSVAQWQGQYWNLYSVFDGKVWYTALALSPDGLRWAPQGKVLGLTEAWEGDYIAANGGVVAAGKELLYAYQAGEKGKTVIGIARSSDGRNWKKHAGPVLTQGPRMSWDEVSLGDPYLIEAGGEFYLFYLGEDRARRQRLGVARSKDGVQWTKQRAALLELGGAGDFDENGLGEPAVFSANGKWVMLYTGRDRKEKRAMGYAVSTDGHHWEKQKEPVLRGDQPWNAAVVCDATVLVEGNRARIWFGGGDLPKPDERLNGQIGYAELSAPD
ncbi:hypothetical protein [Bryobacter aggregatus]|uniref:hypothetical protein n=1 Tax=Bryobacter aggregatus TaxID=360054 RepID=UPI0009B5D24E|nr:hypothetical protein [Bryobacter aggregatus]